ncbi:MAG: response regulator [Salegentibacter sp.]
MITTSLRILLVEDLETDVMLIKRQISRVVEEPIIKVVDDLAACREKMINFVPDVIISDYNLPTCSGLDVLELVKNIDSSVPFIFLTGTIDDEELAANTILAGASGYILKKHMNDLAGKLKPLFKKVEFNMIAGEDLRERLRQNKKAVNQVYDYLNNLNADNEEQRQNIRKIRETLNQFELEEDEENDDE